MIRLRSLYVKDFRSIDGEVNVSLDAPIVLIHGPNGAGKTSLLSAIELALTGAIPSLARAEPDYLHYLPHKDRPYGKVHLEVEDPDRTRRTADIRVTKSEVIGSPLLTGDDARFFSERSYLAQSTLSRLLEIYQHAGKRSDSPLTRFVKELLGLDRMEALIGGLHTAGNIARLKVPVPAYSEVRDAISKKEAKIHEVTAQQAEAAASVGMQEEVLRQHLAGIDASLQNLDLTELGRRLPETLEEPGLVALIRARRELDVSQQSWASTASKPESIERASLEAANRAARSALDQWRLEQGQTIEALLAHAASFFPDVSASSESGYVDRARLLSTRIESDLKRVLRVLDAHQRALQKRNELAQQLSGARTRLARLDGEISSAAGANESVARALADLASRIDSDICPACDRDFSEVSNMPLAAHVAHKVAAMVEQAGRLQSLTQSRASNQAEVMRLDREREAAASGVLAETELTTLKTRSADLTEVQRRLAQAMPQLQGGDRFRSEANRAAQIFAALQNADQSAIVLRQSLEAMALRFEIPVDDDLPTEQLLQTIRATIDQREVVLTDRQNARRTAVDVANVLVAARKNHAHLAEILRVAEVELAQLRRQKAEADAIIDVAKVVAREARYARGRVVRRVFNDELNAVWRDLFVRLAPDEPFIPAFAIPDPAGADIEAVLETHHRRGGRGGNPRAMLSAGNLNTAALTLFLALHLSVKPKLPWLIVDDPVQSMDEVHIAQFAAVLRTLSSQMQRQVIVAVHERSLFDYLALELSPAFEGDRLNVIELGRNAVGQTISRWDPRLYVADRAIAS